jgi:hypothetical protein
MAMQRFLPERHRCERSRGTIASVVGLLTSLLALVLGLLIWTSYGVYTAQPAGLQSLTAWALEYDQALAAFGAEAKDGRRLIKQEALRARAQFWSATRGDAQTPGLTPAQLAAQAAVANLRERDAALNQLHPRDPAQAYMLERARALSAKIGDTRLSMAVQMENPVPVPLLAMVAVWCGLGFLGFGVLSKPHLTTITTLALGALAISSAVVLILQLSQPYAGIFAVLPASFDPFIEKIGG